MGSISKQEKEFLRKVYCKADYLELEKKQQEFIVQNEKAIKKSKIKNFILLIFLAGCTVLITLISHFDAPAILASSFLMMLAAAYYEFDIEM